MKKQYMDFAPRRTQVTKKTASTGVKKPSVTAAQQRVVRKQSAPVGVRTTKVTESKKLGAVGFAGEKKPSLGKVENLNTRFVKSDVPKRPLNRAPHFTTGKTGLAAVKAQKVGLKGATSVRTVEKSAKKPVEKSVEKPKTKAEYKMPKTPFINQGKVAKRPLSKNVYQKKAVAPTEEPKGPVTIISKPEKQAHVGMIVTIILTIILGAAAGTVAFLLIPK